MRSALLLTVVLMASCSGPSSPPAVTPPASQVPPAPESQSTIYSGHYRMASCGDCGAWQGRLWRFTLTVTRNGSAYDGRLRSDPWNLDATLSGTRRADGAIVMSGTAGPANSQMLGATFSDFVVFEDPVRGLHGSFRYMTQNLQGPGLPIVAEIDSATVGPVPPSTAGSLVGAWTGTAKNDRPCTSDVCGGDPEFSLQVIKTGAGYQAFWDVAENPRAAVVMSGTEVGESIVFTGRASGPDGVAPDGDLEIRRVAVRVTPDGALAGEYDYEGLNSSGRPRANTGVLVGTRRITAISPGPFHGEWRGGYVARSCQGDCRFFRVTTNGLPLTLTQSGNQVLGMYASEFILTGTANGTSAVLEGGDENPNCAAKHGGPCTERVRIVVTDIDPWGVMSGTVTHTWNGRFDLDVKSGELFRMVRQVR